MNAEWTGRQMVAVQSGRRAVVVKVVHDQVTWRYDDEDSSGTEFRMEYRRFRKQFHFA